MTDERSDSDSPILEVFPYLCVRGAAAAIDFYTRVFGAQEILRLAEPALAAQAAAAGATIVREPTDQGHGERQCRLRDPFGHEWLLGHEIEKVPSDRPDSGAPRA